MNTPSFVLPFWSGAVIGAISAVVLWLVYWRVFRERGQEKVGEMKVTPRRIATEVIELRGGIDRVRVDASGDTGLMSLLEVVADSAIRLSQPAHRQEALRQALVVVRNHRQRMSDKLKNEIPDPKRHANISGQAEASALIERRIGDILRYYGGEDTL